MPTYEYQCKTCGSVMDVFQSITASPLRKVRCESCGADRPARRLIGSGGGLIFKGSGFYLTDYRSESYKNAAKADSDSKGGGESAKSDTTPTTSAAKSESAPAQPSKTDAGTATSAAKPAGATSAKSSKSQSKATDTKGASKRR